MNKPADYSRAVVFLLPGLRPLLFIVAGLSLLLLPQSRGKGLADLSMWWALLCIPVNIITIAILVILTRKEGKGYKDLLNLNTHRKKRYRSILLAVPLMLILGIGGLWFFSYLVYGYMPVTSSQPLPLWAAITIFLLLPSTIMLSEIPLYVGYCSPRIREITNNSLLALVYPLFFYALQHSFMPLLFDFKHMFSRFLMFIPLLAMIGLWYNKKGEILPLVIGHGVLDFFTGVQLLVVSLNPAVYELMLSGSE